jgi:hypothetical protein
MIEKSRSWYGLFKKLPPIVIPKPGLSAGNLLTVSGGRQIPRAKAALRNDKPSLASCVRASHLAQSTRKDGAPPFVQVFHFLALRALGLRRLVARGVAILAFAATIP